MNGNTQHVKPNLNERIPTTARKKQEGGEFGAKNQEQKKRRVASWDRLFCVKRAVLHETHLNIEKKKRNTQECREKTQKM